jgi:hypothetical protein
MVVDFSYLQSPGVGIYTPGGKLSTSSFSLFPFLFESSPFLWRLRDRDRATLDATLNHNHRTTRTISPAFRAHNMATFRDLLLGVFTYNHLLCYR